MNRSVHKDTCRIWDRGVCNCGPINAAPESRDAGGAAPSADSDGGANKQDRQLVNQGRDEGMRAAFLAMQEAQTGGGEAVAPEAKPTDADLIEQFIAHNSQFHRSADHPAWLYCKDGDGGYTSLRGDLFAATLRTLTQGNQS